MKVILIFPLKEHFAQCSTKLYKNIDMEAGYYPPLGLLYLASYLEKNSDYEIKNN